MSRFRTKDAEVHVSRQAGFSLGHPPRPGSCIDFVVSDALARYWIVERLPGLSGYAELERHAARQFQQIFGDDPDAWVLRIDPAPFARRWLVCALPASIAIELPREAVEKGWQVRSLAPDFIRTFNAHCRRLKGDAVFCLASHEATTIGMMIRGEWKGIRVHPPLDRSKVGFNALLQRDYLQCGIKNERIRPLVAGPLCEAAR